MNGGYEPRIYRAGTGGRLTRYGVSVGDSDLAVYAASDIRAAALEHLIHIRGTIETYIRHHAEFLTAMRPLAAADGAPGIIRTMCDAGARTGVGPMAAVAGAVAAAVGRALVPGEPLIIENGGDVYVRSDSEIRCAVHVPEGSPYRNRLALRLAPCPDGTGVCTSSGTVGHSYSAGRADAAVVLADSTALADAAATAAGNLVGTAGDVGRGIDWLQGVEGLRGALIIAGESMGCWGDVTLATD